MRKKTDKKSPAREVNRSQLAAVTGGWFYIPIVTTSTKNSDLQSKSDDINDKAEDL